MTQAPPTPLRPLVQPAPPEMVVKVDLDDRAFVYPDGKAMTHLVLAYDRAAGILNVDAAFAFNRTHRAPRILSLTLAEARDFARELTSAVYTARTTFVLTETVKITINVIANGYHVQVAEADEPTEFYLSTAVIWRVLRGFLMVIDSVSPPIGN